MISRLIPALLIAASVLCGCESIKYVATSVLPADKPEDAQRQPHIYPQAMPLGKELSLEVTRVDRRHIRIENRTAVPYEKVQVWLNEQYGGTLDVLPIGDSGSISLAQFLNEFGEPFPVGAFLEPEKAAAVVAAVILVEGQLHPISVDLPANWRYR